MLLGQWLLTEVQRGPGIGSRRVESPLFDLLEECVSNVPVNNCKTETQFGRQRNAAATGRGQAPDASTLAAKHVLSEVVHLYRRAAAEKKTSLPAIDPTSVRRKHLKRRACSWNHYVRENKQRLANGGEAMGAWLWSSAT